MEQTPAPVKTCGVCGYVKGVTKCYGAEVCGCCKIFFLRAVTNKECYVCKYSNACRIVNEKWAKNCRACRYAQCLRIQMDPKGSLTAVGTVRRLRNRTVKVPPQVETTVTEETALNITECPSEGPSEVAEYKGNHEFHEQPQYSLTILNDISKYEPREKREEDQERELLPISLPIEENGFDDLPSLLGNNCETLAVMRNSEHLRSSYALGLNFVDFLRKTHGSAKSFAHLLCSLEICCYTNTASTVPDDPLVLNSNLDVSLASALLNPQLLCARNPMIWETTRCREITSNMENSFKHLYCRQTVNYLDWALGSPDIHLLVERDRLNLIGSQLTHVQLLMMMFHTFKRNSPGISYTGGYQLVLSNSGTREFDNYLYNVTTYSQENILSMFRELNVKTEEYILLKTIALYSCSFRLTEEGTEIVRRARHKYEQYDIQLLVAFVNEEYPSMTESEKQLRIHGLVSLNSYVKCLALVDHSYLSRMTFVNIGGMQSQLVYDLHVRQF